MSTNLSQCGNFEPSFPVKITQIVFLSMIFLLSVVGNTLIIVVVYKRPELRKTVNYFIVNMAVSDFVFPLASIPASFGQMGASSWEWSISGTVGLILCKMRGFLMAVSLTVSIESHVCIAFDRFVAVVWPMKFRLISSRFRACAIASIWILAVGLNSPELYFYQLILKNGTTHCYADLMSSPFLAFSYTRVAVTYFAPMVFITILYSVIAVTLQRQDKLLQCNKPQRTDHKKRQAIKMSLCMVALFYLFFLPFAMTLTLWETLASLSCSLSIQFFIYSSSTVFISSTTNPIICFTSVQSFRRGLKAVFNCSLCERFKTRARETEGRKKIILKRIKVISGMENNVAVKET